MIAIGCCIVLTLLAILAAVVNDKRMTRLTGATSTAFLASDANTEKFRRAINALNTTVTDHRKDVLLMDEDLHEARERITTLEGEKLYRIYAKHLATGTFKRERKRPKVSVRRRGTRA